MHAAGHSSTRNLAPMSTPPNPKLVAANEALKKKMSTATLVTKEIFAGGRLGRFVIKPEGERWWYQAGQYTTLGLDTPTGFVARAYSIAGSPLDGGVLEFYIALVKDGALTPTLFAQEVGAPFKYLSAKGRFTLAQADKPVICMVATGTGLAPFVGHLRSLWKLYQSGVRNPHQVVLFHGSAYSDEFGYAGELQGYAADPKFGLTYIRTSSRPDPARGWDSAIATGRVNEVVRHVLGAPLPEGRSVTLPPGTDAAQVKSLLDPARTAFMACGNPGMIEDLKDPIAHHGVTTYLVEEFWKA